MSIYNKFLYESGESYITDGANNYSEAINILKNNIEVFYNQLNDNNINNIPKTKITI